MTFHSLPVSVVATWQMIMMNHMNQMKTIIMAEVEIVLSFIGTAIIWCYEGHPPRRTISLSVIALCQTRYIAVAFIGL